MKNPIPQSPIRKGCRVGIYHETHITLISGQGKLVFYVAWTCQFVATSSCMSTMIVLGCIPIQTSKTVRIDMVTPLTM